MRSLNGTAARHGSARRGVIPALLLLTLVAFGGVAGNGFISFDDGDYIAENPVVAQGLTARGVAWAFTTTEAANWHPLTWLSHLLVVEFFGATPAPHHLANLALHAVNVVLLFLFLLGLTGARWRSALVAALFAVHPLLVESVAWASARKDVLFMFFALLALRAYVRAARRGRVGTAPAPPLLLLLALLAKPTPVTLPFLLLLVDWWPLGRWAPGPLPGRGLVRFLPPARLWREKAPLFVLAAAMSVVTLVAQHRGSAMAFGGSLTLARRGVNAILGYGFYLHKAFWPADLALLYPYPVEAPPWWRWVGWLAVLAGCTLLALRTARRRPAACVGWLWFLGALVPVIGIVHVGNQAWADRYAYLPLVGLSCAVVWPLGGLVKSRPSLRGPLAGAACAVVLAMGALTRVQVGRWHDSFTLYRHALAVTEDNWLVWNLLGNAAAEAGRLGEAVGAYRTAQGLARRLVNGSTDVDFNLAAALHAQGNLREAADVYRDVLAADPADRDALNNLGNIALAQGRPDEAVGCYRRALAADPRFAAAHYNLGKTLAAQGDAEGAARHLREALALEPGDAGARALLGEAESRRRGSGTPR